MVTLYLQQPNNLLVNPGGETGTLNGWQILQSGGNGWTAAAGDPKLTLFGQLVFLTSYELDTRSQLVDLVAAGYTATTLDASPPIDVREWYHGGGYTTTDSYYLRIELRDGSMAVLDSYMLGSQGSMITTDGTWHAAGQALTGYPSGVRYVYFEDGGQDTEFWMGYYGAAMDGASVVVGATMVRLSNDGTTWSAWQPFAPTIPWTLGSGSGTHTVYVQFQDAAGVVSTVTDTIDVP
jgi:F-box protein 2